MIVTTPKRKARRSKTRRRNSAKSGLALNRSFFQQRVKTKHLAEVTRQLATLLSARLPLVQSLRIISEQIKHESLKTILLQILKDVEEGRTLSESLTKYQAVFSRFYISLVQVGEQGGILEQTLSRSALYLEKMAELQRKIVTAMTYPAVIVLVATGAISFLLIAVVPTFADMFSDFGGELPGPTRLLMASGEFMKENFQLIILGLAGLIFVGSRFKKTQKGKVVFDHCELKFPLIGSLLRKNFLSRFCRTLGTLIQCGVPLVRSLEVAESVSENHVFQKAVQNMKLRIIQGKTLLPEREVASFSSLTCQMIRVGEETGELDRMLLDVAQFYEDELDSAIDALTSIIEPVIVVFLGVVLGGTLVAMYLQMFNLVNVIQ